ncbi:MAG TPA: TipAS antibiotic-recognition domain-containing protein [Acidimicrobiia bacterium]|nr:TipAS antibiotic-recognition domain-containing protein [Acidimicrobiia bacterium]
MITAEGEEIARAFAAAMLGEAAAESSEATAVAERHRLHIDRWFYPCSYEVHRDLGELYVTDERFSAYWDGFAHGLAPYVQAAIDAKATEAG